MNERLAGATRIYADIEASKVEWLWYPYVPYGKITLIQGDPGEGKSSLVLKLASLLSQGKPMPDGMAAEEPVKVIYQAAEDSPSDTIKPRLVCYGAYCRNIVFIEDTDEYHFRLEEESLIETIEDIGARVLVYDPIQAFFMRDKDASNNIRLKLSALGNAAEKTGCAIILIGHMNKNEGGKDLYRGLGSIDVAAAARSVLSVSRLEESSSVRVLRHIKSSLTVRGGDFGFEITDEGDIEWIGLIEKETEQVADQAKKRSGAKFEKAKGLLLEWLSADDLQCSEILSRFKAIGISQRTVNEAKKALDVHSVKTADGWRWHSEKLHDTEEA
ncbi:MAG: AAA family ATPase [Lachnospiraceae bacterium]|nr:AAA family ATPase [Lachnospiraceae bacterium]